MNHQMVDEQSARPVLLMIDTIFVCFSEFRTCFTSGSLPTRFVPPVIFNTTKPGLDECVGPNSLTGSKQSNKQHPAVQKLKMI